MQNSVDKNLKDFEALLEKCKSENMKTRTTLRPYPNYTR
jgi:hypothetical protein